MLHPYALFTFSKSEALRLCSMHDCRCIARAVHVHYAPHHQMQCTVESCTLNFISVPNWCR